jgi:GTP-binding protein HflX
VDSTVRKVVLKNLPFLLTDTVGFIRKLPTLLIESFKSTLDEIIEADILLHVADISSPHCEEQIEVVNKTLVEIGAGNKPTILILNKIDLVADDVQNPPLTDWEQEPLTIRISANKQQNMEQLREMIFQLASEKYYAIFPNYVPKS